ncbi:MAG TPA: DUF2877 domain-containing protein [Burkholderiales bacterium]
MQHSRHTASVAGRFAREAASRGEGEVCAVFRRSFYARFPGERYACIGEPSLGCGPLNALVGSFKHHVVGEKILLQTPISWSPPPPRGLPDLEAIRGMALVPEEGLGCLITGRHNALSEHAQPAIEAIDRWLAGHTLAQEAEQLVGLGPGLTPSGDDYLGGVMVALRLIDRGAQADALWRWLEPRLKERTGAISAAHLAAAAAGEAHEALHEVLNGQLEFERLDAVGHCSGWDGLAGAMAVLRAH